jgi:hypothetical protein
MNEAMFAATNHNPGLNLVESDTSKSIKSETNGRIQNSTPGPFIETQYRVRTEPE